jgi:serine beta-lactamase-like protein LACTB, mitochondrial
LNIKLFFLILIIPIIGNSQNTISGTVVDKATGMPVDLVTVGIVRKGIGTNTNQEGQFRLIINELNKDDTLRLSIIGYEIVFLPLLNFKNSETIKLEQKIYSLDEITVRAKKLVANDIVKKVIENRTRNYDTKPFKLEAYYRDLRNVNGRHDHLIEVALNTYGKGIDNYHQAIELLDTRKIDLIRFTHEENLLNQVLRLDYIANNEGFIKLADFKKNNYKFEDIRLEDGKNVYVITSGVFPERRYTYYIKEDDYAITRLEMEDWYAEKGKLYTGPIDKTHQIRLRRFKVINIYKTFKGKYYPDYLSALWDYDKYNTATKSAYENSSWLRELRINHIVAGNTTKPDPSKLMTKFGAAIDDQMTQYNPDFWKNFNVVPLATQVIADLERGGAIEEQFIRNGNKARKKKSFKCDKDLSPTEKIICLVENYQNQYDIPGAQLAVSVNGKLVISKAFGYSDLDKKTKATNETPFRIASVSKTLTSVAALKLMEDGKLNLKEAVQTYVPSFPQKKWNINSLELLGNTSGIRHYVDNEDFYRDKQYASATESIETFKDDSLLFEPGTSFYYSSYGFNLLGAVIEGASGMNYLDYLQSSVIVPSQMKYTYGAGTIKKIENESEYYFLKDIQRVKSPEDNLSYKWPSGGIVSTAEDLTKFGSALLNGDILKKETFQMLLTTQTTKTNESTGYSLGWYVDTDSEGAIMIHHSGTAPSYSSHLLIYPTKKIVIAYLANTGTDTYFDKDLADQIIEIIESR